MANLTPDDEVILLRRRLEALEARWRALEGKGYGSPSRSFVGLVESGGALPTAVPRCFLVRPQTIGGAEVEGGPVSLSPSGPALPVQILPGAVPAAGDGLVVRHPGDRWVARKGGPLTTPPTGCPACVAHWPTTLYLDTPYGRVTLGKDASGTVVPGSWTGGHVVSIADGTSLATMGGIYHTNPNGTPSLRVGSGVFGTPDYTTHGIGVSTAIHYEVGCFAAGTWPYGTTLDTSNYVFLTIRYPMGLFLVRHATDLPTLWEFEMSCFPADGGLDLNWNVPVYGTPTEINWFGAISLSSPVRAYTFKGIDVSKTSACGATSGIALDFQFLDATPTGFRQDGSVDDGVTYRTLPPTFEVYPTMGDPGITTCFGTTGFLNTRTITLSLRDT